jgi:hypothetical protein
MSTNRRVKGTASAVPQNRFLLTKHKGRTRKSPPFVFESRQLDQLAIVSAFGLRQQVVIPLAIRVGTQIGVLSGLAYNCDVHSLAAAAFNRIKSSRLRVDLANGILVGHTPRRGSRDIADVGNVLVRTHTITLIDAGDEKFIHGVVVLA